jgi:membrane protein implicated in regulation of membrane protease activity
MEMDQYIWWAVAGMGLIIIELMTGTFFLLILGLAAFGGALAAYLNLSFTVQVGVFAVLAAVGMFMVSRYRTGSSKKPGMRSLDYGHAVELESWEDEAHGIAKVRHRNATWDAKVIGPHAPGAATFYITSVDGNTLHVSSSRPAH